MAMGRAYSVEERTTIRADLDESETIDSLGPLCTMSDTITRSDEGKRLLTPDGSVVGVVELVRDGTAFVRVDSELARSCPPWRDDPCENVLYALDDAAIKAVTSEGISIRAPESWENSGMWLASNR